MSVEYIPKGYNSVIPYLLLKDIPNTIEFLINSFGAVEKERITSENGEIMHAEVQIGDSIIMMGKESESLGKMNSMIYLYLPDTDAAYNKALENGAVSIMEPEDQFYGDRNAGVGDSEGNIWWIGTHIEDVSEDDINKRMREKK